MFQDWRFVVKGDAVSKQYGGSWKDPKTGETREVKFAGIELRVVNPKENRGKELEQHGRFGGAAVYLNFITEVEQTVNRPGSSASVPKAKWETLPLEKKRAGKLPKLEIPVGSVIGSVVFDDKNIAWVTVQKDGKVLRTRLIVPAQGLDGAKQKKIRRQIGKKLKQSGGRQPGQQFAVTQSAHLQNLWDQRNREGSAAILRFLLGDETKPKVDLLIIAPPTHLVVSAKNSEARNRALANLSVKELQQLLVRGAEIQGIQVFEPDRPNTDLLCSCGAVGVRFSVMKGQIKPERHGDYFGCPGCGAVNRDARFTATLGIVQGCSTPERLHFPGTEDERWAEFLAKCSDALVRAFQGATV
jgi:hypothetical protein